MPPVNKKRVASEVIGEDEDVYDKIERLEKELQEQKEATKAWKQEFDKLKAQLADYEEESDDDDDEDDASVCDGSTWSQKYFLLKQFKQVNGHCKVPRSNKQLGQWVNNQRRAYRNVKNGISGTKISQDKIDKLDKLGFCWGKGFPEPATWEDRLAELKQYHGTFGHCNVHVDPDPALRNDLAKWVAEQRKQGKRLQKSQPSSMTKEQWKLLNELQFQWKVRKPRRS